MLRKCGRIRPLFSTPSAKRHCSGAREARKATPVLARGFFPRKDEPWTADHVEKALEERWHDQAERTDFEEGPAQGVHWEGLRKLFVSRWLAGKDAARGAMFPSCVTFVEKLKNRFIKFSKDCALEQDSLGGSGRAYLLRHIIQSAFEHTEKPQERNAIVGALERRMGHEMYAAFVQNHDLEQELMAHDLKAIAQEHQEALDHPGNGPLRKHLLPDPVFQRAVVRALYEVKKLERQEEDLSLPTWKFLVQSFNRDPFFRAWCPNFTEADVKAVGDQDETVGVSPFFWDDEACEALTRDELEDRIREALKAEDGEEELTAASGEDDETEEDDSETTVIKEGFEDVEDGEKKEEPESPFVVKSRDYFQKNMFPQFMAHSDLLRHTLEDCPKLVALDPKDLAQGYSGELGHERYGLWKASGLPVLLLRPHLLELRDLLAERKNGRYVEVVGDFGTGKSVVVMYAAAVARKLGYLTLYLPDAHKWIEDIGNPIPANSIEAVFFQHDYARDFFKGLLKTEEDRLDDIPIRRAYLKPENYNEEPRTEFGMETLRQIMDDPGGVEKYEQEILDQWFRRGSGDHKFFAEPDEEGVTLGDMVRHGAEAKDCPGPAALLYEFMEEIRLQQEKDVLIAADGVNLWDEPVRGLCTPRYPQVYGFQLSMVDCFSQFQHKDAMPRVTSVMAPTSHLKRGRASSERLPSDVIMVPGAYEASEFDCMMFAYQAMGLSSSSIARDDCLKVEGSSGRLPRFVQRTSALY